jgi:quinol-cytochrome oxidoreductase complex cytochrome b subunit
VSTEQLIPLIVIAVVLPLVLLRNRRPRTLRPEWMWVAPVIVVALIGFGLWGLSRTGQGAPTDPASLLVLAVGLALGAAAGWWRGKTVTIHKEPDGTLKAQASPLGLILIVGLLVARQALRPWMERHAADWHVSPLAIIEAFMLFAVGMVVMQRVEMWIRARRIQAGGADAHVEIDA